jgi:CubicO group peptidase (beta-lactamase class C family)
MESLKVPGLSITLINEFQVEWEKHYGVTDVRKGKAIDYDTLFEAGSASKTLTAITALQLVSKELVDLDEDVNSKLKNWQIPENSFTKDHKISLRKLLTHSAGINRPDSMFISEEGKEPTLLQILKGESPALNDPVEVCFVPGSDHQYSNLGYIIVEKLIQDITEMSFTDYIREEIFRPLKMNSSHVQSPTEEIRDSMIVHHDNEGKAIDAGFVAGAFGHGGLISTPSDIAKFVIELIKAYQGKSDKILSQEVTKQMISPEIVLDPSKMFGFTGQGLGVFLIEKDDDIFFTHPGTNAPGAVCMMIGSPSTGKGVVIMSNGILAELLHIQLLFSIAKEYKWPIWT